MRAVLVLCLAAVLAQARTSDLADQFRHFKTTYGRRYESAEEESKRFKIFSQNMRRAAELQSANPLATFGMNEFADLSATEFKVRHNAEKFYAARKAARLETVEMSASAKKAAAGQQQDWRPKGAVTPIKNQGQCGSCWAFSTTGGIEGQWFLAGHPLTSLSEQDLVSCDTIDSGCNGGLMDNAFQWLLQAKNGSIVTEASYPYVSGNGNVPTCQLKNKKFGAKIDGFKNVQGNEDDMAAFVFGSGPLSIGVDATSWQTYVSGIMTNCQSVQVDHGVLIVGFDDNNSPPYWIVKNSWGKSWGEDGYIRVQKGTDQCLLTSNPCTSEVKPAGPTPAPVPPTPPPSPSGFTFTQKTCIDRQCQKCTEMTFDQNTCITAHNASFKGSCQAAGLVMQAFATRDCSGASVTTTNPINICSVIWRKAGNDERFVQNICPSVGPTPAPTPAPGPTPAPAPTPAPTFSSGWENLFPPPYQNAPTIMMAIAAIDKDVSYVPGGENGAGFTAFEFNNQYNGVFTPLNMPSMALMVLAIAAGGTVKDPKGVVGGIGIGNGVQYFVNSTTIEPSKVPTLMVQTQDIRMTKDGQHALVIDGMSNTALFSVDSGKTFNEQTINVKLAAGNCTSPRYGALLNDKVAYVTLGNWPCNDNSASNELRLTEAVTLRKGQDGKIRRVRRAPTPKAVGSGSGSGSNCGCMGYSAQIAKTSDGGNSWESQVSLTTDFYFNGVDCFSETHCVAVGEGFDAGAGGHIYLTEDGKTWKQVHFAASGPQGSYSFMSVRFSGKDGKEVWVGGSLMVSQTTSNGIFFHSADGGKNWKEYPHGLPNIGEISSISFLENGIGLATAMTTFDDSTVLRYDPSGPPPPGYFVQSQCLTNTCLTALCQNMSFPEDTCLQLNGGGSAMANCEPDALQQKVFASSDCTGSFNTTSQPLAQCQSNGQGGYFENFCPKHQSRFARLPRRGKDFQTGQF